MTHPSSSRRGSAPGVHRRRAWIAPLLGALTALALLVAPTFARADSGSTLTVVGTSDVSDSGLIPTLIQPLFHAAYPQYQFKYIGTATGTAITEAENGSVGASVLIVHAASLENQFVAGGYSYEPAGRALWTNDFVLAGPASQDPANVSTNASSNPEQAFADIANTGYAGGSTSTQPPVTFVSRGGTPGTTVEEHQIWAKALAAGLIGNDTAAGSGGGFYLCAVDPTLGGGDTPIALGQGVTANGQACPQVNNAPAVPSGSALPDWYVATGATQGPNVVLANACATGTGGTGGSAGIQSPANTCYVFSDRGTYDYLQSGYSPSSTTTGSSGVNLVSNLTVRTQNASALTNYFHAYIINPAKSPSPVNLPAAQAFVNFITSSTVQSQLAAYLNNSPGGAPFTADAQPAITAAGIPSTVQAGQTVTVSGTVANKEPGYAVPANQTVTLDQIVGGVPVAIASAKTNSGGGYVIPFVPPSSGTYQVTTGLMTLAEPQLGLSPAYSDELSPGASAATSLTVQGSATIGRVTTSAGTVSAQGSILPAAPDSNATATLLARPQSSTGAFKVIGTDTITQGQSTYAVNGSLKGGKWTIQVQYSDGANIAAATTATQNVTVPSSAVKVSYGKLRIKHGKLTLSGRLSQGPISSAATVRLYALSVGTLKQSKSKGHHKGHRKHKRSLIVANASHGGATLRQVAKVKVRTGHERFTLRHTFKAGHRYLIQLRYEHKGQTSTYSKYKYLNVR